MASRALADPRLRCGGQCVYALGPERRSSRSIFWKLRELIAPLEQPAQRSRLARNIDLSNYRNETGVLSRCTSFGALSSPRAMRRIASCVSLALYRPIGYFVRNGQNN